MILDAETYEPYEFDKVDNKELLERVKWWEEKGTEDEMAGWYHRLNGHEFE